ncbi:helix-turn-helix domain-containing protein [Herpetosiphon llansteffanensis]|uniref:helix-turn-helix domain-containing protein n=1 Tax=Herpetosiphon llansteffanensis TaxID=2094568 RepID=UPI001F0BA56E|nr:helix-turn-helix domain-containing protein [Herpetosiphon llansteffanensis]
MRTLTRCYTYRLQPTPTHVATLVQWAGCRRFVTQRVPELGAALQANPLPSNRSAAELSTACGDAGRSETSTRNGFFA